LNLPKSATFQRKLEIGFSPSATGRALTLSPSTLTGSQLRGIAPFCGLGLKGSLLVGATNRQVTNGAPGAAAPPGADTITVYGGGSVTVVIAPWLQGTVGVRLLPNGEIELAGEIALPASVDIFPEKSFNKNIFTIGIDIPIVGVAVAGQRIGIFANISGGLDLSAGIGPGQLQQLRLGITYNPAHEDETHVTGAGPAGNSKRDQPIAPEAPS
jgi:hypothetical protein